MRPMLSSLIVLCDDAVLQTNVSFKQSAISTFSLTWERLKMTYDNNENTCDVVEQINRLTMDDLEPAASMSSIKSLATVASNPEHPIAAPPRAQTSPVKTENEVTFSSNSTSASVTFGTAERRRTVTACLSFLSGTCKREDCRYVHLKPEIRLLPSSVCAYHVEGECKRGDGCRYFHGTSETLHAMRRQGVIMYNPKTNVPYDEVPEVLEDPKERAHKRQDNQWHAPIMQQQPQLAQQAAPAYFQPQYMYQPPPPPPPMQMPMQQLPMQMTMVPSMSPMHMQPTLQMQMPMMQQMMMPTQPQQVQYVQVTGGGMMPMSYMPMPQMPQQPIMMMAPQQQMMIVGQPEVQYYAQYS